MTEAGETATAVVQPSTDREALARLERFGGSKLLLEMIRLYSEAAPQRVSAARSAVESGDLDAADRALHSLKSSSAQLGAVRMQQLSGEGEAITRSGTLEGVSGVVRELEGELVQVLAWLASVRAERSS